MKYRKKTLRSRFAKSIPVRVYIFLTKQAWLDFTEERGIEGKEVAGMCYTQKAIGERGKRTIREVHVYLQSHHIGAGYVAHEMTHAAMSVRRAIGKRDEETLALLVGDLCWHFWNWCYTFEAQEGDK